MSYPNPYPEEYDLSESTQEYLDRIEREHPWPGPGHPPTGSLQEKMLEEARWGDEDYHTTDDDCPYCEEDDDGEDEGA